jgi:hypothetical protein
MLQALKEHEVFAEMLDGYRFAISLAIASGSSGASIKGGKNTFVNVGTLDKDGNLRRVISAMLRCPLEEAYDKAELLAEWGVRELDRRLQDGILDVAELLEELQAMQASE